MTIITCTAEDCTTEKIFGRGMCNRHYKKWYKANNFKPCSIEGCQNRSDTKGLCGTHIKRLKLYGDPLWMPPAKPEKLCEVPDCGLPHYGIGLCENHYARRRRHGGLEDMRAFRTDPVERFWSKVEKTETCWLWTDGENGSGYGSFGIDGTPIGAHVYSVQLSGREIPKGMHIDHLCRIRKCVNPNHLEVVTPAENNRRMWAANRELKNGRMGRARRSGIREETAPEVA